MAVEQNNYLAKIVNLYIVYDLETWPKIPLRHFTLKKGLFGGTNIVKSSDKEKYVYSGYRIALDRKGERKFDNDYGINVIVFGVDNGSHLMLKISIIIFYY